MSAGTNVSRDRPPGPAPRGTVRDLGAIRLILLVAPSAAVFAGADELPVGLDGFLGAAFGSVALALVAVMPLAAALRSRRYRVVCWYFAAAGACLALAAAGALVGLAAPVGLVRRTHPDFVGLVDFG